MDELSKITDRIFEIVSASQDGTILGVRLGAALKKSFPSFVPAAYQSRNLRIFIKTHVPRVVEKDYTGVDVVYTLASPTIQENPGSTPKCAAPDTAAFISLPADPVTWKAYSNPSYPFAVTANRETGELKAVGEREIPREPWVSIPKLPSSVHHQIASEFVDGLAAPAKAVLTTTLKGPQWYVSFFGTTKRLGLSHQWGLFKRERLIRHFTEALRKHGIQAASASPKHDLHSAQPASPRRPFEQRYFPEDQLRDLISRLAFTMPIEELRSIRMPIGIVVDALRQ